MIWEISNTSFFQNKETIIQELHLRVETNGNDTVQRKFYARQQQGNEYCWLRGKNKNEEPWIVTDGIDTKTYPFPHFSYWFHPIKMALSIDLSQWRQRGFDHPFFSDPHFQLKK